MGWPASDAANDRSLERIADGGVAEHAHDERPCWRDVAGPLGELREVVDERRFQGRLRHILRDGHRAHQ